MASDETHERTFAQRAKGPVDIEGTQLRAGLRVLIKRERRSREDAARTQAWMEERGLRVSVFHGAAGRGESVERHIVFAAQEPSALEEALSLEARMLEDTAARYVVVVRFGELLGYPSCCARAFAESERQDDATHVHRLSAAHSGQLSALDNWVSVDLRPYSHFPCVPGCEATRTLARATLEALSKEHADYVRETRAALSGLAFIRSVRDWVLLPGARERDGGFDYAEVLSPANLGLRSREDALGDAGFAAFHASTVEPLTRGKRMSVSTEAAQIEGGSTLALGSELFALDFSG